MTLASREPLVSKEINEMIKYTSGKFLNLKINTNASLLTEEKFMQYYLVTLKQWFFGGCPDSDLYKKLRVNGSLEKTIANIKI